jgi:DNA primase
MASSRWSAARTLMTSSRTDGPVFPRAFLDELRSRIRLSDLIGRRVELIRRGREFAGLCPFHTERTPSFFVVDHKRFFHCFGCAAHGDAVGFVMRANNLDFEHAVEKLAGEAGLSVPPSVLPYTPRTNHELPSSFARVDPRRCRESDADAIAQGRLIWGAGSDPRGTLVEIYLASRKGLALPPSPVLRWASSCRHWDDDACRETFRPAMLARVDDVDGRFVGVHRTYLRPDGRGKADLPRRQQKKARGRVKGAAVRLAPAAEFMAVAEGIETALSVIVDNGTPTWAAPGGIRDLLLPVAVRQVLIMADHDEHGAGERAAYAAADRWRAERRRVWITMPLRPGTDANDLLGRRR